MATTYQDTITRVRDWANRVGSERALPDSVIEDGLLYAADEAYRLLEVAALEHTGTYPALVASDIEDADSRGIGVLRVPRDSTGNFLQIRRTATTAGTDDSFVYNVRQDLRGFEDRGTPTCAGTWTRKGNEFKVFPAEIGDVFEVHYYRRLPALDARYTVNAANANTGGLLSEVTTNYPAPTGVTPSELFSLTVNGAITYYATMAAANAARATGDTQTPESHSFYGLEAFNWLRDEQNKILLFGALWHVMDYLENTQEAQTWGTRFQAEIQTLNTEERMRRGSGGNAQVTYSAGGLI